MQPEPGRLGTVDDPEPPRAPGEALADPDEVEVSLDQRAPAGGWVEVGVYRSRDSAVAAARRVVETGRADTRVRRRDNGEVLGATGGTGRRSSRTGSTRRSPYTP